MSPTNRSYGDRSPSPEYNRSYRSQRDSYRDPSPSSRSERRGSPHRRGPSPTRSERGYRDRREYGEYRDDRDGRDRYYSNGGARDSSPDRYSDRSHRSERGSSSRYGEERVEREGRQPAAGGRTDYLKTATPGPKTSSPMEPSGSSRSYQNHGAV